MRKIRNKRILLYAAALALLLLGGGGTDIGSLRPVEAVQLREERGLLILETDTGDMGWGMTVEDAVRKLKETAPGQIYLDTADYLLIEEGLEAYLQDLRAHLKDRTAVAYGPEALDLEMAVAYLRVHRPAETIGNGRIPGQMLAIEGGKMILKKIQEKQK